MAELVARREPAIIMPTLYFNINDEMACYPGTIAISPELVLRLYEELCSEAARNGFTKIVLFVGHGGSEAVTDFFQHSLLHRQEERRRGYYVFRLFYWELNRLAQAALESGQEALGHGGEAETAYVLRFRADLVHMDKLPSQEEGPAPYLGKTVPGASYLVDWIRRVPRGYHGLPYLASPEKGGKLAETVADECANIVRQIKAYDPERDR